MHVLRDYVTDTWGEDVGDHTAGETVERTYSLHPCRVPGT
ncbi:MAG: hypothetical protein IPL52_05425 [Flavobacteriales bacterium]|nr:hypothetical protein [Flavobacteriales bacterium]